MCSIQISVDVHCTVLENGVMHILLCYTFVSVFVIVVYLCYMELKTICPYIWWYRIIIYKCYRRNNHVACWYKQCCVFVNLSSLLIHISIKLSYVSWYHSVYIPYLSFQHCESVTYVAGWCYKFVCLWKCAIVAHSSHSISDDILFKYCCHLVENNTAHSSY